VALARFADIAGGSADLRERIVAGNTAAEAFSHAEAESIALGDVVARAAQGTAVQVVEGRDIAIEVVVFDREGRLVGRADFAAAHAAPPRNRRR
jgi:cobalt-precorrin-5B (C1)-methyltransferase